MVGPIDIPVAVKIPNIPCASPLLASGIMSATYAAVAVGFVPVENPCRNLNNKNPKTV